MATVMFWTKQVAEAVDCFGDIIAVFARANIYQPILDEAKEVGPLLAAFQDKVERTGGSRELRSYINDLSAAWKSRYEVEPRETSAPAVTESLSPRESDILRLIAEGLSNKEIARDLNIAPETVKSHIKQIFTKLRVEMRAQAVSRAQILGLAGTRTRRRNTATAIARNHQEHREVRRRTVVVATRRGIIREKVSPRVLYLGSCRHCPCARRRRHPLDTKRSPIRETLRGIGRKRGRVRRDELSADRRQVVFYNRADEL